MSIWLILLVLFVVLAFMTHPSLHYAKCQRWRGERFAHRGLHDIKKGLVENTLPAFAAARDAGFGMELDIRRWWFSMTTICCAWPGTSAGCAS